MKTDLKDKFATVSPPQCFEAFQWKGTLRTILETRGGSRMKREFSF